MLNMRKRIVRTLRSAAGLAAAAAAACAPAAPAGKGASRATDADPALWAVRDADTTIYLFGTVHALDGKRDWFNDEIKTAYDGSGEVVFEILAPTPEQVKAKLAATAIDPKGRTLSSRLTPGQAKIVAAELASIGAPPDALEPVEPWFAATQLALMRFMKKGILPEHGVESRLREAAKKDGKKLGELESFNWQIDLFDTLPEPLQLAMLQGYIDELDEGDAMLDRMMKSWADGDVATLASVLNDAVADSPQLAKLLLADRNERWAGWIERRLAQPGTVFVAVGAGHLGGPDSVQRMLAAKGLEAKRVQ